MEDRPSRNNSPPPEFWVESAAEYFSPIWAIWAIWATWAEPEVIRSPAFWAAPAAVLRWGKDRKMKTRIRRLKPAHKETNQRTWTQNKQTKDTKQADKAHKTSKGNKQAKCTKQAEDTNRQRTQNKQRTQKKQTKDTNLHHRREKTLVRHFDRRRRFRCR